MSVIGIVCEFNPFHNGHKYLIDTVKGEGDTVVAVMSGNFVQRAEPALFPKEYRIKAALLSGVDIVLELPFVYATSSAEVFSQNAVRILDAFGCDKIAFGTENTDIQLLEKTADVLSLPEFDAQLKAELSNGVSYPKARQAVFDKYGLDCDISTPNNILAIEYLKAIREINSPLVPIAENRAGAGYNDDFAVNGIASATHIRNLLEKGESFGAYVPCEAYTIYKDALKNKMTISKTDYNIALLTLLREKLDCDLSNTANMAEGLENRVKTAIADSTSLSEIYESVKTKRYTHSRVRRAVLSVALGIAAEDIKIPAPYVRLIGFNVNSSKVLGDCAKNCKLPFVTSYSDILKSNCGKVKRVFNFENKSSNIYSLLLQNKLKASFEMKYQPIKMK